MKRNNILSILFKIFYVSLILIVMYVAYYVILHVRNTKKWPELENAAKQEIMTQVAHYPEVKIIDIFKWEGDTATTLQINDNARVSFWYRKGGPPRIGSISFKNGKSYNTEFDCENRDMYGNRMYSYNSLLEITHEYPVGKLFDFEVRSVEDLIQNFDKIVAKLDLFPRQTETVTVTDRSGMRQMTKNPDAKYAFTVNTSGFGLNLYIYRLMTRSFSNPTCFYYVK